MAKTFIITGGSRGIGLATVQALLDKGCTVYEISRGDSGPQGARHIKADVSDEAALAAAIDLAAREAGRIDGLINNAGFGISGAVEFTRLEDARRLLDVNLLGAAAAIKAAAGHMRQNGGGRIINISSVAAPIPIPFQAWYSVSKAGINSLTVAAANELHPFGISVCAVMPGDIRTGFTAAREKRHEGDDIYSGRIGRSVAVMEKDEQNGGDPAAAGRFIAAVALKRRVKPLYTIGLKYKFFVLLTRLLPTGAVNRIVSLLYAQ